MYILWQLYRGNGDDPLGFQGISFWDHDKMPWNSQLFPRGWPLEESMMFLVKTKETTRVGQRVICAHWKRVICAHCKRVICAQRNRVIRAQRAVIRAHWGWEPAISGLVVGGGGGGVGWDDNVHIPMHTQAQQPHHLSCCWEETGTALSWSVTGGVGWVKKVHVPMPAHAQQPHHLSCCRALTRIALSWSVTRGVGGVGWGAVGWDDNVHIPMHTQAQQPHHLSCCWEETGTALSWSVTGGVGWVNKVHVPMPCTRTATSSSFLL